MLPDKDQNSQDQPLSRQDFLGLLSAGIGSAAIATQPIFAARPGQLDSPSLTFVEATRMSIELQVTAGSSGAPGGFVIQWRNPLDNSIETATFSAAPSGSRYALDPGQSVNVKIGDLLFDAGVASTHVYALLPIGDYHFTAIAIPVKGAKQSDPSPELTASLPLPPAECPTPPNCTTNLEFWKSTASNPWPVTSLKLGATTYEAAALHTILRRKTDEFGLNAMAKQLIAAKLNVAKGADPTVIAAHIEAADLLLGDLTLPALGNAGFATQQSFALVIALTNYNEGASGPRSCC